MAKIERLMSSFLAKEDLPSELETCATELFEFATTHLFDPHNAILGMSPAQEVRTQNNKLSPFLFVWLTRST
jgi:hypothetical protein